MWSQGQFPAAVVSEKEPFQVKSRPRVQLWERSLGDEEDKEPNGQWLDDPQRKTMRQMPKSMSEEE